MPIPYNADIAQRLQLETRNKGVKMDGPLILNSGQVMPVWSPSDRFTRTSILISRQTGGAGTIYTEVFTLVELQGMLQGQGNGNAAVVAPNPPKVWPKRAWLDYFFFTKTANPTGGTLWRTEVFMPITENGVAIYTLPLLNSERSGLTGAVTDFWQVMPTTPVPIPLPSNTDFFEANSIIRSIFTDSYGIESINIRIQTNNALTNISNMGIVITSEW